MPLLRNLPLPFQSALRDYRTVKMHVLDIVNEHRATRTPNKPRDVIDSYLDEVDKVSSKLFGTHHCLAYLHSIIYIKLIQHLYKGLEQMSVGPYSPFPEFYSP